MTFALEIYLTMAFGAGVEWLACALFTTGHRADEDEPENIRQAMLLKLDGSRALNRALTEENERLQAELSELNALRRDGRASLRGTLQ